MKKIVVGQRFFSKAELELGLGKVVSVESKNIVLDFPLAKERRIYRIGASDAIQRYEVAIGEIIKNEKGNISFPVVDIKEEDSLLVYYGRLGKKIKESELYPVLRYKPSDLFGALSKNKISSNKSYRLRQRAQTINTRWKSSPVRGMIGPRVDMIPHQFYLCSRACSSSEMPRLMLSDEVGLGKTIEAGMIWHSLNARGRADRTLILVPESLKHQWISEMRRRFNQVFTLIDEAFLRSLSEEESISMSGRPTVSMKMNPFLATNHGLCTMELLMETPALREDLLKVEWDLLIVDEAHHLLCEDDFVSKDYQTVYSLIHKTKGMLLLSGTPLQFQPESHFHRLKMLDPVRFYDYTKYLEEQETYKKIAADLSKLPSDPNAVLTWEKLESILPKKSPIRQWLEKETIENLEAGEWVRRIVDAMGTGSVMFRNTRKGVGGFPKRILKAVPLKPNEKYQQVIECLAKEDQEQALDLHIHGLLLLPQPKYWQLDERIVWIKEFLASSKEKVLLITENESAMKAIATELAREFDSSIFTCFFERMSIEERDKASACFARKDGAQILLSTEIGSEGRNFQFANRIILWDLSLDAALVEQRIGRLDRIGQERDIEIYVPYVQGSGQEVMFKWYNEGLEAFSQPLMTGGQFLIKYSEVLLQAVIEPKIYLEPFTEKFLPRLREECDAERKMAEKGRDRLLEFNSRNPAAANKIIKQIQEIDSDSSIPEFVFDALRMQGVEVESGALPESILLVQGKKAEDGSIPGMPKVNDSLLMTEESTTQESRLTVTLSRQNAMQHEGLDFLSIEHPLAQGAIDYATTGTNGAVTCAVWENSPLKGSMCMEYNFVLDFSLPASWGLDDVAGPVYLRCLINSSCEDVSSYIDALDATELSSGSLENEAKSFVRDSAVPVNHPAVQAKISYFSQDGFAKAKEVANKKMADIVDFVSDAVAQRLESEYQRLKHLASIRGGAENTQTVNAMKKTIQDKKKALTAAGLRLDGIRLLVCK